MEAAVAFLGSVAKLGWNVKKRGGVCRNTEKLFGYNKGCKSHSLLIYTLISGKRGIRTLGTVTRTTVFETVPIDHSGIFP